MQGKGYAKESIQQLSPALKKEMVLAIVASQ